MTNNPFSNTQLESYFPNIPNTSEPIRHNVDSNNSKNDGDYVAGKGDNVADDMTGEGNYLVGNCRFMIEQIVLVKKHFVVEMIIASYLL